jgi:transposase
MKCFIQGSDRTQVILLPAQLDDYVTEEHPVRVIDIFVDELDLAWALASRGSDNFYHYLRPVVFL